MYVRTSDRKPYRKSSPHGGKTRLPVKPTRTADGRLRYTRIPTQTEIDEIGVVAITEFELNDRETQQLRTELYKINKDGIRRYRTLREAGIVLVWRIK